MIPIHVIIKDGKLNLIEEYYECENCMMRYNLEKKAINCKCNFNNGVEEDDTEE